MYRLFEYCKINITNQANSQLNKLCGLNNRFRPNYFLVFLQKKEMGKSRILIHLIAISAFLLGLFLSVVQNVQIRNSSDYANIHLSNSSILGHIEWIEELEFGDEEKWLDLKCQFYTRIEEILPLIQTNRLVCIRYGLFKTTSVEIRANGPSIFLLDQVFLI